MRASRHHDSRSVSAGELEIKKDAVSAPDFTAGFQVTYNWKRAKKMKGISPFPEEPPPGAEP